MLLTPILGGIVRERRKRPLKDKNIIDSFPHDTPLTLFFFSHVCCITVSYEDVANTASKWKEEYHQHVP